MFTPRLGIPGARVSPAVALDPRSGRLVLFGGQTGTDAHDPATRFRRDTWSWDGRRWWQLAAAGPADCVGPVMAADPNLARLVLVCTPVDRGSQPSPAQVWSWDGRHWTRLVGAPPGVNECGGSCSAAWDGHRRRLVFLLGGSLWAYGDARWTRLWRSSGRDAGPGELLQWPDTSSFVGLAGTGPTGPRSGSPAGVYRFTGSGWAQRHYPNEPAQIMQAAFDPEAHSVVVFGSANGGGVDSGGYDDTMFVFAGSGWSSQALPGGLAGRQQAGLGFDPASHGLLLFSGAETQQSGEPFLYIRPAPADTWSYHPSSWRQLAG